MTNNVLSRHLRRPRVLIPGLVLSAAIAVLFIAASQSTAYAFATNWRSIPVIDWVLIRARSYEFPWTKPNVNWPSASPETYGIVTSRLDELQAQLADRNTKALLVIKDSNVIYEWYDSGKGANDGFSIAGITKAVVISMALLTAIQDGRIGLDEPAWKYIPAWENDPTKSKITIRHLATHSSGIKNVPWGRGFELNEWEQVFEESPDSRYEMAINEAPIIFAPGTGYSYSSVGYYPLSYAITASLQGTVESDILTVLEKRIMEPIGVPSDAWRISYGEFYEMDGLKLYSAGGARYTARALAKVGQLMLFKGAWQGQQLFSPVLAEAMVSYGKSPPNRVLAEIEPASGLGWQVNYDGFFPSLPHDAFLSTGADHQLLLVIPSQDLVVVRMGGALTSPPSYPQPSYWDEMEEYIFKPLMDAVSQP